MKVHPRMPRAPERAPIAPSARARHGSAAIAAYARRDEILHALAKQIRLDLLLWLLAFVPTVVAP